MTNWGIRRIALALLAIYIAGGAAVVLWPTRVDAPYDKGLSQFLAELHADGVPGFVNYAFVESSANVVMFVPLGLLLTVMWAARLAWIAPVVGFVASSAAELSQLFLLPDRVASVGDVLANTGGAIVGTVLLLALRFLVTSRKSRRLPSVVPLRLLDSAGIAA